MRKIVHRQHVPEPWSISAGRTDVPAVTPDTAVGRINEFLQVICRPEGWGIREFTETFGVPTTFEHHGKAQKYAFPPKVQFIPLYEKPSRHESMHVPVLSFCIGMMPTAVDPTRELFVERYWGLLSPLDGVIAPVSPPFPITGWSKYHLFLPPDIGPVLVQDTIQSGRWDRVRGSREVEERFGEMKQSGGVHGPVKSEKSGLIMAAVRAELGELLGRAATPDERGIIERSIRRFDGEKEPEKKFQFAYRDRLLLFGPLGVGIAGALGVRVMATHYQGKDNDRKPGEKSVYDRTKEILGLMDGRSVRVVDYGHLRSIFTEGDPGSRGIAFQRVMEKHSG